jgi:hypothetical protein
MKFIALIPLLLLCSCATRVADTLGVNDPQKVDDAIRTDNLAAVQQIFANLPAAPQLRSASDQNILNHALQMTASKGKNCNKEIAAYLYSQGALADYYNMSPIDSGYRSEFQKYKIPFCGSYLVDSHKKYISQKPPSFMKEEVHVAAVKNNFIKLSYNNMIEFFNNVDYKNPKELSQGMNDFGPIIDTATFYGKEACSTDFSSAGCISYGFYKKLPEELIAKKDFSKKSDAYRLLKEFSENLKKRIL